MTPLLLLALTAAPTEADWAQADRLSASATTWNVDRAKLAAHPVQAREVSALLAHLEADCLAGESACRDPLSPSDQPHEAKLEALINVLGEVGSHADLALLDRLDARGLYTAGRASERILSREWEAALPALRSRCRAPNAAEVSQKAAQLNDFFHVDGRTETARALTPAEGDDLAYFLSSVDTSTKAVGEASETSSWTRQAPHDPVLDTLATRLQAVKLRGDASETAKLAREYLQHLGYPGAITGSDQFGWHGARFSGVMRQLADALERTGGFAEAAALQRAANPGGGMCGTGASYRWSQQVKAVIRDTERAGTCATAERLLEIEAYEPLYGTAELTQRGFDLKRLYRGALLTMNREDPKLLDRAFARLDTTSAAAAQARLKRNGAEAWESRVHALDGLVALSSELEPLVDLIEQARPETAQRALEALAHRVQRPDDDPCGDTLSFSGSFGSEWSRHVTALSESCATRLEAAQESSLATRLTSLESYPAHPVQLGLAKALSALASKQGAEALARLGATHCTEDDAWKCTELARIAAEGAERITHAKPFGPKTK
ncbi:MAG: hypothetical protein QM723_04865 [Myxococcaceae bacterium]